MRIQKYMSEKGMCSRREAEELIKRGLVKLNGAIVREMGVRIDPAKDKVEIIQSGEASRGKRTLVFYKPRGMATEEIIGSRKEFAGLHPTGRLDKESEGLILLSNDGVIAKAVTGDEHLMEKEYEVTTQESVAPGKIKKLEEGVKLEDGMTLPAQAEKLGAHLFRLVLKEGRKHQIRRMADAVYLTVVNLKRVRIGKVRLGRLAPGKFRELNLQEISELKKIAK